MMWKNTTASTDCIWDAWCLGDDDEETEAIGCDVLSEQRTSVIRESKVLNSSN
jgi:hypothetical protein